MNVEDRLAELGLVLPPAPTFPPGVEIPFAWVRVHGQRAYVSGHGPLDADGRPPALLGRVGTDLTLEQGQAAARSAALAMLSSLRLALGSLDRIEAWLMVSDFVNATPGMTQTTAVINAFSEVIHAAFGPEVGRHARTAIGVDALPLNLPVVVAAELAIRQGS